MFLVSNLLNTKKEKKWRPSDKFKVFQAEEGIIKHVAKQPWIYLPLWLKKAYCYKK